MYLGWLFVKRGYLLINNYLEKIQDQYLDSNVIIRTVKIRTAIQTCLNRIEFFNNKKNVLISKILYFFPNLSIFYNNKILKTNLIHITYQLHH